MNISLKTATLLLLFLSINPLIFAKNEIDTLVVLNEGFENIHFHEKVFQWKSQKSSNALSEVIKAPTSDFIKNKLSQEVNFGYNQTNGWSKFSIENKANQESFYLVVQQSRLDSVQLFVRRNDTIDTLQLLGKNVPTRFRSIQSNDFVYKLSLKKGEIITCFLYSYRKFGHHACVLNINNESTFTQHERFFNFELALIIGLSFLAALFGITLFFFIKDKTYLYYGLYSLSYIVMFLADAGFIHSFLYFPKYQFQINYATSIMFFVAVALHLLFTIELLNIAQHKSRWFYQLGKVSIYLFFSISICLFFLPLPNKFTWGLIYFSYFIVFYMDLYILIAIWMSLRQRQQITYFYLVGFLLTLIIGTILMLANTGFIDGINQNTDIYYLTPLLEILIMVWGFGFNFSNNLKEKYQFQLKLNESQQAIISTQENERKRIGQDLHDDVGNTLAAVKTLIVNRYPKDVESKDMIEKTIEIVRQISHNLMPVDFNKYQLSDVLQQTLRKLDNKKINIQFIEAGDFIEISPRVSLEIYRIFNEMLNNLYRHSKATEATVQLIYQEKSLILMIEDNGMGFDLTKTLKETEGIGLKNIHSRASIIGAKLTIQSDPKGTLILLDINTSKK